MSTIKRDINKLKDNNILEYVGNSKSGYWEVQADITDEIIENIS